MTNETQREGSKNEPNANRNKTGSHPVATGVGAAGGAATGAAIGSLAGPIGTAVGVVAGAVAGGMAGRSIAATMDPKAEDEYWKMNYSRQPYVESNTDYATYQPAYRTGFEGRVRYHGKAYEDAEIDLRRDYDKARGAIPLGWDKAKHAIRDAWNRVDQTFSATPTANGDVRTDETNKKVIDKINNLIGIAADGKQGYENAAEDVKDPAMKRSFQRFSNERAQYVQVLQHQIYARGGKPEDDGGDTRGVLHRTWMDMKAIFTSGSKDAIIKACCTGEEAAIKAYDSALAEPYISGDLQRILVEQRQGIQDALTVIRAHSSV